jgi:hypothetical protein
MDTIPAKIVKVVKQKSDQTYTVILEMPEEAEHLRNDKWTISVSKNIVGTSRVDRIWHVYFDGDPGLKSGDTLEITVERPQERVTEEH